MHDEDGDGTNNAYRLPSLLVYERIGARQRMRIIEYQLRRVEAQTVLTLVVTILVLARFHVQLTKAP